MTDERPETPTGAPRTHGFPAVLSRKRSSCGALTRRLTEEEVIVTEEDDLHLNQSLLEGKPPPPPGSLGSPVKSPVRTRRMSLERQASPSPVHFAGQHGGGDGRASPSLVRFVDQDSGGDGKVSSPALDPHAKLIAPRPLSASSQSSRMKHTSALKAAVRVMSLASGAKRHREHEHDDRTRLKQQSDRAWSLIKTELKDALPDSSTPDPVTIAELTAAILKFWHITPKVRNSQGQDLVTEEGYLYLNKRIYKALVPKWQAVEDDEVCASLST